MREYEIKPCDIQLKIYPMYCIVVIIPVSGVLILFVKVLTCFNFFLAWFIELKR